MRLIWARGYYTPRLLGAPSLYVGFKGLPGNAMEALLRIAYAIPKRADTRCNQALWWFCYILVRPYLDIDSIRLPFVHVNPT
eukprot:472254-Pyramimonas_sp.AAC.2